MGTLGRVALGIALGASATLIAHPSSRRIMTGLLPQADAERMFVRVQGRTPNDLPNPPHTLIDGSLWMQLASERALGPRKLSETELSSLIRLAQAAAAEEPQNAFWRQMQAVLYFERGDIERAKAEWVTASRLKGWNDQQSDRLLQLATQFGGKAPPLAWHHAATYYLRQEMASEAILRVARRMTTHVGQGKDGLRLRLATLQNGSLMGGGARSVSILRRATEIINLSGLSPGAAKHRSLKELEEARGKFHEALRSAGMEVDANEALKAFRESDGRMATTQQTVPEENVARTAMLAVLAATVPSALLLTSAIGGAVWFMGSTILRFAGSHSRLSWPLAILLGSGLGIGVYSITRLPLAGIVALLCAMLLTLTPRNERQRLPSTMGIAFQLTLVALSVAFLGLLGLYLVEVSTPASILIPRIGLHGILFAGALPLGLALLVLVTLLLVSPIWAFGHRVPTPFVLGKALDMFGRTLAVASLAGVVIAGPLSVYADTRASDVLARMVGHEPLYYVNLFE